MKDSSVSPLDSRVLPLSLLEPVSLYFTRLIVALCVQRSAARTWPAHAAGRERTLHMAGCMVAGGQSQLDRSTQCVGKHGTTDR